MSSYSPGVQQKEPRQDTRRLVLALIVTLGLGASLAMAQVTVYTTSADFALGTVLDVNHDAPHPDQLQLDTSARELRFIHLATAGGDGPRQGTLVRIDVDTGAIMGEFRVAPNGVLADASRTVVDGQGNVWLANRDQILPPTGGAVVKIGVIVGGTRCNAFGAPDVNGEFLQPPFDYSTAIDRDGDGLIRTSSGQEQVLAWPNISDGTGSPSGGPALVEDAVDELILVYQKTHSPVLRHASIDPGGQIWVAGYPGQPAQFEKLNPDTGALMTSFRAPGCGGFGGLVDSQGVMWSTSLHQGSVMRRDLASPASSLCVPINGPDGIIIDPQGHVWISQRMSAAVAKIAPDGLVLFQAKPIPGAVELGGLAASPLTGHIFVSDTVLNRVYHLDTAGDLVGAPIPVDLAPMGLTVDDQGRVWVACRGSDSVNRIEPSAITGGQVDLVLNFHRGTEPFQFSKTSGPVDYEVTQAQGTWNVIEDSGENDSEWGRLEWNASEPNGAAVVVEARASNDLANLSSQPYSPALNSMRTHLRGRYMQARVQLQQSPTTGESPILFDLAIENLGVGAAPCGKAHRRSPGSLLLYPEFDSRPGTVCITTVSNTNLAEIDVEYVYIDGDQCLEFNRTETLTGNDTLSLLASAHNPNQAYGYFYIFAKDPTSGAPIQHDALMGQILVLNGFEAFEYSVNALSLQALATGATTDLDGDGVRDLDGLEYTMAPAEILVPRFLGQSGPGLINSELVLLALTGGPEFTTWIDFLIYNDNEEEFSTSHSFHCWERINLLDISNVFSNAFLAGSTNHAPNEILGLGELEAGWFRIDGALAQSSTTSIEDPAVWAVLIERLGGFAAADLPFELCSQANGDLISSGLTGDQ